MFFRELIESCFPKGLDPLLIKYIIRWGRIKDAEHGDGDGE